MKISKTDVSFQRSKKITWKEKQTLSETIQMNKNSNYKYML